MDINNYFLLFPVLLPFIAGVLLMFIKFGKREHMQLYILLILVIDLASIGWIALQPEDTLTLSQFFIAEGLHVFFHVDMLSKIFSVLIAFVWLMVGIASFEYMAHEKNEQRFYFNSSNQRYPYPQPTRHMYHRKQFNQTYSHKQKVCSSIQSCPKLAGGVCFPGDRSINHIGKPADQI